jgi:LacI family transcriptional regulator
MDPKQVARQLRSLAPPVGLYCAHDAHAAWAVNACHEAGLAVPDEVAILGTDNDLISCELAPVGLSSIQLPGKQIGRRAIEVLHAMIDGSPRPTQAERIAPAGVVVRQSTRVLAGDPCVRSAQEYIRRHVSRPTSVEDVLAELDVSRSLLQQRFRAALGRTPLQEIHHVHIEHAKTLLVQTDLPTTRIAELAGFASYPRFAVAFKKLTATTPGEYRRQFPRAPG